MKNQKWALFFVVFVGMSLGSFSGAFSEVAIDLIQDQYVLPVAELASTKTNPEIIHMSNGLIAIDIIPNRGRILSSFKTSTSSQSFLYQNYVPDPMLLPGGLHTVEFGGYYLSLPWNTRDRQPFDLEFEIRQLSGDFGEVYLFGKDMFQKTFTEVWVRMRDDSSVVEIEIRISNTSKKDSKELDFRDYAVFSMDEINDKHNNQILLPVEKVRIIESRNDWAGAEDSILEWPAPFSQWSFLNDYVVFRSESQLFSWFGGIYYPEEEAAFVKFWTPHDFFTGAEIWSWGKNYPKEPGAAPYVVYSNTTRFTLQPQESKSFTTYFTVITDLSEQDIILEAIQQKLSSLLP